jgi:TolB-like protein
MKNVTKVLFAALLMGLSASVYAEDKYDQLAKDLTDAATSLQGQKIAIIPFSYADTKDSDSKDGSVIAARLTVKMINMHKFDIIERSALDKVMNELKLQASGTIDASSAQQLGKVLGVQAIVTGTLVETSNGQIEVNARMIKTETAQAIGASQVDLDKDWVGDASSAPQTAYQPLQPQQPTYQQPAYQAPAASASSGKRGNGYGFFDVIVGVGSKSMNATFNNSGYVGGIYSPYKIPGVTKLEFQNMTGIGAGPVGLRVGGFGEGNIGGDFEFSLTQNVVQPQALSISVNGYSPVTFSNYFPKTDNYLTMTSFGMSGDLLIRGVGKVVDPYIGIGLGLSLNSIQSPFIWGYSSSGAYTKLDEFGVGFIFRIPVGMRIKLDPTTQLNMELRYELNSVSFNRGISGESDNILAQGVRFVMGIGFGI